MGRVRGYFGIGIENVKTGANLGTLWRSAHNLGAAFIFTIGNRYRYQATDTPKSWRHLPLYQYETFGDLHVPRDCKLIGVEYPHAEARPLQEFAHPERAVYLLGAEDVGLSAEALDACDSVVYIPTDHCLNVAVTGSIVMYDRTIPGKVARWKHC